MSEFLSYEMIALLMFSSMMLSMLTGQRVFATIGFVGVVAAALLWGNGGFEMGFSAGMKLMKWYPLLTLPLFIYMGYMLSESGIAEDLYKAFHVWFGGMPGGLAVGTIGLMVVISAMNGLSVAGMAIGASIALPELLRRGYDKIMVTLHGAREGRHGDRHYPDLPAGHLDLHQGSRGRDGEADRMSEFLSYEMIALLMFSSMMLSMLTGQRVFATIGFVGVVAAALLWGNGGFEMGFSAGMKLMKWYPLLTLPLFIYMGYMLSESGIAEDLYKAFHVWFGGMPGGLAVGTIGLMVVISAMNGLSVAGMAIGASIALPELLRRGYDKIMVSGVIQAGSSLGILIPPSVVLVLYGMIARQPVSQLWLAVVFPGLLLATMFCLYIIIRCRLNPALGPALPKEERDMPMVEKLKLARAGILPFLIFFLMMGLFLMGITSLVESSAVA